MLIGQLSNCSIIAGAAIAFACNVGIPIGIAPTFKIHEYQRLQTYNKFDLTDYSFVVCQ